jgi:hypothetical protein
MAVMAAVKSKPMPRVGRPRSATQPGRKALFSEIHSGPIPSQMSTEIGINADAAC